MTDENRHTERTDEDQLILVYSPGLWPYRSPLDRVSWSIGQCFAEGLSGLPGFVGYASPGALVDPAALERPGEIPLRVFRALPPIDVIQREAVELDARWAITGRLLTDREGMELWLNCLDGPTGDLLWTGRIQPRPSRLLWTTAGLLRRMLKDLGVDAFEAITVKTLFPTNNWQAFMLLARLEEQLEVWDEEDVDSGVEIVKTASHTLALDHDLVQAGNALRGVLPRLVEVSKTKADLERAKEALIGDSDAPLLREMRQLVHKCWLTLAQTENRT